jgi:hypothetical protein
MSIYIFETNQWFDQVSMGRVDPDPETAKLPRPFKEKFGNKNLF